MIHVHDWMLMVYKVFFNNIVKSIHQILCFLNFSHILKLFEKIHVYFELMCCQCVKKMYYNITQNSVICALLSHDWQLQKFSDYTLKLLVIVPAQKWFKSFLDLCCSDKLINVEYLRNK